MLEQISRQPLDDCVELLQTKPITLRWVLAFS